MEKDVLASSQTDYKLILSSFWSARKFLLKVCATGLLVGILVYISMPKEYETCIYTAPESTSRKIDTGESFSTVTSIGGKKIQDAIIPSLYPKVVSSTPFLLSLFDIPIKLSGSKENDVMKLSDYLSNHQHTPWWSSIRSGITRILILPFNFFNEKESGKADSVQDNTAQYYKDRGTFRLSNREAAIAAAINSRITVDVDKKKRTVTLRVRMQDPHASAIVADSVMTRLNTFVSDYRTKKERANLEYAEKIHYQARQKYYEAQDAYAHFADANLLLSRKSYQKDLYNLQVAKEFAYKEYAETLQQLQLAKIRVYKKRPVFAVIEPATVPLSQVSPSKMKILSVFIMLSLTIGCGWIYFKNMHQHEDDKKDI